MPRARRGRNDGRKALGPHWGGGRLALHAQGAAIAVTALTHGHADVHGHAEAPDTGGGASVPIQGNASVSVELQPAPVSVPVPAAPAVPAAATPLASAASHSGQSIAAGGLLIRDVRENWPALCEAVVGGATDIDVSGVRMIDTAGVQLLLVLAMEARRREQPLRLSGVCDALDEAVRCLGLQSAFESVRGSASP